MVSVLMPVYNRAAFLPEAMESILAQDFTDFEFIIVDDCSTDNSVEIVESYNDPRIRLYMNEQNGGVAKSLNHGLRHCRGKYVARMDSDDIASPHRLSVQVRFMEQHPEVMACGSSLVTFGHREVLWRATVDDQVLRARMLFNTPIYHPTAIIRRAFLAEHGLSYNENEIAEDYELWYDISRIANIANVPDVLLRLRIHDNQTRKDWQVASVNAVRKKMLAKSFGIAPNDIAEAYLRVISHPDGFTSHDVLALARFFSVLEKSNARTHYADARVLREEFLACLAGMIRRSRHLGRLQRLLLLAMVACRYPVQAASDLNRQWRPDDARGSAAP